ncbi:hypothetical protein GCM10027047_35600 [Rhodococcus aerolatus]
MTDLEQALLDLGMEDLIALPETLHAVETVGLLHRSGRADDVARALVSLLESHRIQVWGGRWQDEPELIDHGATAELLLDTSQYEFGSPADSERRVYYVNVDNLRAEPDGDVRTREVPIPGPARSPGEAP